MTLLVILALTGVGYTLLTSGPTPIRQVELTAVWTTLGLIAIAVLGTVDPAVSLLLAGLVIAPLWFFTLRMNQEYARSQSANTAALWHEWRSNFESQGGGRFKKPDNEAAPLSAMLGNLPTPTTAQEFELTQMGFSPAAAAHPKAMQAQVTDLELLPIERQRCLRGRNI